ncbi:PilN domain-containing protein [Chitinilyticum litopenaei]|uniref:PilN domain-containing protein n=1 Tax=Chitinilyticum litopenaei TaxID=1121276 RepID=UPI0009DC1C66|nr:PilN domain-containing protein [Chitinilyticum litopenaei]
MIRINLLPHREQKRLARQRRFVSVLVFSVIAAAGIVTLGYLFLAAKLEAQNQRNEFLRAENLKLDQQIAEIEKLKADKQAMLEKKTIVERLQSNRTEAVRLMDELTKKTPEGIYLKDVKQADAKLVMVGLTQSNARVSGFMQNLTESPLFEQPTLVEVKASTGASANLSEFTLEVSLSRPDPANASSPAKGIGGRK